MNKTTIDWPGLTHTLNPAVGCIRQPPCSYCYARDLHNKRHNAYMAGKTGIGKQYAEHFGVMQFFPERLKIVKKSRIVKKVFVGSMTDICYWKPEWIQAVIDVTIDRPEIKFMFLTKTPFIYHNFSFPRNCWLGVTITGSEQYQKQLALLLNVGLQNNKKFVSVEPLIGVILIDMTDKIDLVIVGAMTGKNAVAPKREWIESINHPNIHFKKNIKRCL